MMFIVIYVFFYLTSYTTFKYTKSYGTMALTPRYSYDDYDDHYERIDMMLVDESHNAIMPLVTH